MSEPLAGVGEAFAGLYSAAQRSYAISDLMARLASQLSGTICPPPEIAVYPAGHSAVTDFRSP